MSNYSGGGAIQRFTVESVLGQSFKVFFKHGTLFLGVALIFFAPISILFRFYLQDLAGPLFWMRFIKPLINTTIATIVQASIAYAVFQVLTGQRVSVGKSMRSVASRIFQLLMIEFVSYALISLGFMLLIVPGIILLCMWAVTEQVCVVEELGIKASFSRSASLTDGYRFEIMIILLFIFVVYCAAYFGTALIMNWISDTFNALMAGILYFLVLTFEVSFFYVVTAVMYYRLRAAKEGLSVVFE